MAQVDAGAEQMAIADAGVLAADLRVRDRAVLGQPRKDVHAHGFFAQRPAIPRGR